MARRLIVRPLAVADIDDAAAWYEQQQQGLGSRYLDAVDHIFNRIRDTPDQFPTVAIDIRRGLLHTFPFAVYFQQNDDAVVILAVLHMRRDPRVWRGRA